MNASRLPLNLLIAGICFAANMVSAQLESRATTKFNALTAGPAYGSTNPSPTSQFSGVGVTSSAPNTRTAEEVAAISVGKASLHPVKPVTAATYRNSAGTEVINLQLRRGRMGYSFSSAVPRYYLGDTIQAPSTLSESLSTPVAAGFWRSKPVRPGETFSNPDGSPLIDTAGVALPNIVDNAAVGTPLPALTSGQYESFYYSPHADQVFASQAGSVEICWVSASPQGEGGGAWQFRRENFTVSGASVVPVRKIYWTEKSFDGPRVNIPTGRIELANPIYTANFTPLVSEEYRVPGFVENPEENAQVSSEKRTLWFENFAGNAQLAAFNREGRLMIEYLGPEISPGRLEFLGADVVEVIKSAPTQTVDIELGKRVMPRDGAANLVASPALNIASASQSSFYATLTGGNGDLLYYAEKENLNPDRILFYWMEDLVSSIRLAADANSAGVSILWPISRDSYALTATGQGQGYVTLMFGNGRNPNLTPASDPPVMKIIKVVPELYNGDLKVLLSSNPLDEKVSLRHSGDFAADTENYEFEWYWAPPSSDGTQPATYTYNNQTYLGNENLVASRQWRFIQTPESARPQSDTFSLGPMTLPASMNVKAANYTAGSNLPGVVFRSNEAVDFSSGIPAQVVFSANVGDLDGFALYVNGNAAVVHQNWINALNNVLNNAYDLRLVRVDTLADLPTQGKRLVIVAEIAEVLHFRIFDAAGVQTVNIDESELTSKATEIANLRSRLNNLWSTTNLLNSDKNTVVASVSTIVGYDQNEEAATGLSVTGLAKQFTVDERFFIKGNNTIEVAVYTNADTGVLSSLDFRLEGATRNDQVLALGSPWSKAVGSPTLDNRATVGGSPSAPLGSPLLVMSDNFFTLRYRAKEKLDNGLDNPAYTMTNGAWTNWTRPALVEGWIKRVLAAINPFNQRMTDLYNNAVNTDVSLLTQAGTRWEGDISLTLDAVNDYGLIEIYETVLKRGKEISIDSGYNYAPANDALLLAAGYLNDLYAILGNEAYADAANPTISIDGLVSGSEVNTSRFSFEGQVASVLDEELALLRGRDDFLSPQVTQSPFYNRLFWNYTRGIDSGEALYATNYNIKEKVGSSTEDGSIDALDAQRMFPQGHGDAYGHYLTALKGYYKLLQHSDFTWTPRTESLNVLGNTVAVDYKDERKFAESAANIARTAEQIVALSLRQQYNDDPANGWTSYRDGKVNSATGNTRRWGLDAWTSRANQGAYYHWAVGNAMLPDVDAVNSGIQKIDRTTVLELQLLPVSATAIQSQLDKANAHLNPLGLSSGAIAFDISPAELKAGKSHYEQVYERALAAVLNAKGAFDQAASMTRLLRNQDNTVDDYNTALQEQERAFNYQLIDLYGKPYPGDLGAGKTYVQGYDGPDLYNWFVVDKASGTPGYVDANYDNLQEIKAYDYQATPAGLDLGEIDIGNFPIDDTLDSSLDSVPLNTYKVYINREGFTQFSEDYWKDQDYGTRPQVGALQQALLDAQDTWIQLDGAVGDYMVKRAKLKNQWTALDEEIDADAAKIDNATSTNLKKIGLKAAMLGLEVSIEGIDESQDTTEEVAAAIAEFFPRVVGLANDVSSAGRGGAKTGAAISSTAMSAIKIGLIGAKGALDIAIDGLEDEVDRQEDILDFRSSKAQLYYEYIENWRDLHNSQYGIGQIAIAHQRNLQAILDLMAQGDRILLEREIFRKRAATTVQGYRTNDLAFRAFRDESLEQYRTLFDLAARYTYLAAKSYDYETGLLGTTAGQAVISRIVSARALGDLTGGQPQATVSSLGDSGLAGTMAQLNADFSVAKGRLGINNPDTNGTLFSLRQELFRLLNDPASSDDDAAWQQTLQQYMVSNLMSDADVAAKCMNIRKADGSAVPGIIIPFTSTIQQGKNFFGLPLAGGDHAFSASNFATKIYSVGVVFPGYVGMDPYAELNSGAGAANTNDPNVLSATPYVYLIPAGTDKMLAPALGDSGLERSWLVEDQALPLPYNLGANDFSDTQFFKADGTLTEQPWITRKHQAFRAVDDPAFFYGLQPAEFSSSRLIGRSAWNTQWKLVIPAYGLLNDEQEGLDRFAATVEDIKLFLRTYSNSGN